MPSFQNVELISISDIGQYNFSFRNEELSRHTLITLTYFHQFTQYLGYFTSLAA